MPENKSIANTNASRFASYGEYFDAIRNLASEYGDIPTDIFRSAWQRASIATNPFIQNKRVKSISTMPRDFGKEQIVKMLKSPYENEKTLREVAVGLEWTAYPYRKIRMTYQGINTDKFYHYPAGLTKQEAKSEAMWREGTLIDKFNHAFDPSAKAHQVRGQAWQEGKVVYYPRWSIDKAHNKVNYAFWQQLPSDWVKIVGFNSESGYTVMFNLMYLLAVPGADYRQFGELLTPYLNDFNSIIDFYDRQITPDGNGKKYVYASYNSVCAANGKKYRINFQKFNEIKKNAVGNPQLYNANGKWAYYVTLPVDAVWVFEIDDTTKAVAPMSAGLFVGFNQISAVEDVALAVMQNPLVSIAFGEIPYFQDRSSEASDPVKLSPTGREYYISEWLNMLTAANASGIAIYPAPLGNMHLETLPEATGSGDMTTKEYGYNILKSGMSGLIPINSDPRAGAVEISAKLEEAVSRPIYSQMQKMMESIYRQMGLKFDWRFKMFGGFVSDAADLENARKGLQIGMLSETCKYLALRGLSLWEDMSISNLIMESGILDLRIPPITSYSAKNEQGTLPPQPSKNDPDNVGGRPTKGIDEALESGSEAQEGDLDG